MQDKNLFSFVEKPRKFIIAITNLCGVSTKLNKHIVFTMQMYKKLKTKTVNKLYSQWCCHSQFLVCTLRQRRHVG